MRAKFLEKGEARVKERIFLLVYVVSDIFSIFCNNKKR